MFAGGTRCAAPVEDDKIRRLGGCRYRRACFAVVLLLTAACRGASPAAPPGPAIPESPRSPLASELRIGGVPPALAPGTTAQLSAQTVLVTGAVRDCAAVWSVDNTSVATVSPSGLLTGGSSWPVKVRFTAESYEPKESDASTNYRVAIKYPH